MSPANPSGTNTLALATSPYLRQHADNPVHWQQWTPQALAEAAARAVPILLSVGYAACHWCHVMAHESFDDDEVAAAMNAGFVCIKVDREERPDIDAVYMNATVALTGQGGWPMTCFLTPNGRPFFCGTYYPKAAFLQLLSAISETWRERRAEVEQASDHIAAELRSMASGLPGGGPEVAPELCDDAVAGVLREQDTAHGGFGGAPKFPPSALLEALMRHYERTRSPAALEAVARTGNAMARGGIYDQLGGGFARYSVDGAWVVPHFEKMLYDNALLLRAYAHWARRTGDPVGPPGRRPDRAISARRVGQQSTGRHVHLVAGCRRRRPRGFDLRLDAGATDRGARRRRRPLGGRGFRGDRGRHLRARDVCAAVARRPRRRGASGPGPRRVAGGPPGPGPARPRRQGRHVLERVGDHRAGRSQRGPGRPRVGARRAALRDQAAGPARRRRPPAPGQPGRGGRRQRRHPGGPRDAGHRAAGALPADLRGRVADGGYRIAGHRGGAFRRPAAPRSLVRHRRRRRAADAAALRSAGRGDTVGRFVDRRGAADGGPCGRRCSRRAVLAAGGRHAAGACGAAGSGAAVGRALAGGRRGGGARTAADRRRVRPAAVVPAGRRAPAGP
ncbi:putative Tat (twin-arginine translocation) pathway signal sequence containing protein, partial [Mycobacterium tuberculosis SUMu011]